MSRGRLQVVKAPLYDKLEYAVLEIIMATSGTRHDSWGGWMTTVGERVPELQQPADLKAAFRLLRKAGILRLTKPDQIRRDAHGYSGDEADDDAFFSLADSM